MSSSKTPVLTGGTPSPEVARTTDAQAEPVAPGIASKRLARIHEYLVDALEQVDALQANLGAASSDLMLLGFRMKDAIETALRDASNPLGQFNELMPAIESYLKVVRQIDRLAQLDRRLTETRVGGEPRPR